VTIPRDLAVPAGAYKKEKGKENRLPVSHHPWLRLVYDLKFPLNGPPNELEKKGNEEAREGKKGIFV